MTVLFRKLFLRCQWLFWHLKVIKHTCVFFSPFVCSLYMVFSLMELSSGHCGGFTCGDFPCAFRPTGNDRTRQLRPTVSFNQLGVSKFYIDSCSWPIKVNKRTRIQTFDTWCWGKKTLSHVRRLYRCLTLNTEIKSHRFISTRKLQLKLQRKNTSLQPCPSMSYSGNIK